VSGAASTAAAEREALHSIEEQTVVLQRQIAELTLAMEGMQKELRLAQAARAEAEKVASAATEPGAAATPWAMLRAWTVENWTLLVAFPALIALIGAILLIRRRREVVLVPTPITATQAEAFNLVELGEPSIPETATVSDEEALVPSRQVNARPRVIPPVATPVPVPEFHHDVELGFDHEVVKTAEDYSAYSTLEREQPGMVAKLTNVWGTPQAAAKLQDYVLTPRRSGRPLSHGAIAELKLLQAIALELVADEGAEKLPRTGDGKPWRG
jgi:hypothetical protein